MTSSILALDSSGSTCTVALRRGAELFEKRSDIPRGHARTLLPMIHELLDQAGLSLDELDTIAFVQGPGSFTGLRIGCGVAQGLAFGAGIPVMPLSSLAVMAWRASQETGAERMLVSLEAREEEVYWGAYERRDAALRLLGREQVGAPQSIVQQGLEAGDWLALGSGWAYREALLESLSAQGNCVTLNNTLPDMRPDAAAAASLAQEQLADATVLTPEKALPVYLKEQMDYQQ